MNGLNDAIPRPAREPLALAATKPAAVTLAATKPAAAHAVGMQAEDRQSEPIDPVVVRHG